MQGPKPTAVFAALPARQRRELSIRQSCRAILLAGWPREAEHRSRRVNEPTAHPAASLSARGRRAGRRHPRTRVRRRPRRRRHLVGRRGPRGAGWPASLRSPRERERARTRARVPSRLWIIRTARATATRAAGKPRRGTELFAQSHGYGAITRLCPGERAPAPTDARPPATTTQLLCRHLTTARDTSDALR